MSSKMDGGRERVGGDLDKWEFGERKDVVVGGVFVDVVGDGLVKFVGVLREVDMDEV